MSRIVRVDIGESLVEKSGKKEKRKWANVVVEMMGIGSDAACKLHLKMVENLQMRVYDEMNELYAIYSLSRIDLRC